MRDIETAHACGTSDETSPMLSDHAVRRRGWRRVFVAGGEPDLVHYDIATPHWQGPPLSIAMLSDFHTIRPWSTLTGLHRLVARVNALPVDMIVLLGDYIAARPTPGFACPVTDTAAALAGLRAPLGVHAILGNHDWRDDDLARASDYRESGVLNALRDAGIPVMLNDAVELNHQSFPFWIVGYDSQQGHRHWRDGTSRHDPDRAFRDVPTAAPAILLAHEPDCFAMNETRALLQLSGHTHGGQANFFGWRPLTPSEYPDRYAYGHIRERGQHLVVSGGIGYSHVPMRLGAPPEVTLVTLKADAA
ncbi:metallophosphoesterase [Oceaniglobus indicus]|uniref:metallophosphoesterase n=1 Tax=Oceaniglobus indicus TaxID=2047749 RepID=UPI000C1789C0|nr:metallophosphoesterase [Oceaniglobus indicus]